MTINIKEDFKSRSVQKVKRDVSQKQKDPLKRKTHKYTHKLSVCV